MALIEIKCPRCSALQDMDDTAPTVFCSECGEKISAETSPAGDTQLLASLSSLIKEEGDFVTNLSGYDECAAQFDRWMNLIARYKEGIAKLDSDINKEKAINEALVFCERVGKTRISYMSGELDRDGKDIVKTYSPDKARAGLLKDAKSSLIYMFNNLPARLELFRNLESELGISNERVNRIRADLRESRDSYKTAEKAFWAENPEVLNRKRDAGIKSLSVLAIGLLLAIVAVVFAVLKKQYIVFAAAFAILCIAFYVRKHITDNAVKRIKAESFPPALKALAEDVKNYQKSLEEAEKAQISAQQRLAAFEATRK
ncbi:MAG TPA: hypothetical protein PLO47_04990 [Bacillota bacterium]|nr:hypothetical protein [Bacillota bacterium]